MKFFLDTADTDEIRKWAETGLIDGITTNPSLILKSGKQIGDVLAVICDTIDGPVSGEVTAVDYDGMMKEADVLSKIAKNICIKLPMTLDGLRACRSLVDAGHQTNVTLCFSANQALLAAKAGATFVSPFIGRLDDMGIDGMELIQTIRVIFDNYGFETQILSASVRTVNHVRDCAVSGSDVVTVPPDVIQKLVGHPLTDKGLAQFLADWEKTKQTIA